MLGFLGTQTLLLETTAGPGVDPVEQQGTNQGPVDLKGSMFVDWKSGHWNGNVTLNFESGYDNVNAGVAKTDVDGYRTVDVQASYKTSDSGWHVTAGIQNIFDADFPFFDSYRGVDSAHVDFRRRIIFFDVVKDITW